MQQPKQNTKPAFLYQGALLLTAILWGGGFLFSQIGLDAGLSPAGMMLGRFIIATLLFAIFFGKKIIQNFKPEHLIGSTVIGVLLFVAFLLQTVGLRYSTPSNNAFITASNVIMVPFLWWIFTKRRPPAIMFPASFLSFIGIAILSINFSNGFSIATGDLITLAAALLFACQITATGLFARKIDPHVLVFFQFVVAGLLSFVAFLFMDGNFSTFLAPKALFSIGYLGIFSTGVSFLLQTIAQVHVDSSKAAIILSTESLFGSLFSVLAGYDAITIQLLLGGSIIFFSVLLPEIVMGRKTKAAPNISSSKSTP